MIASPDPVIFSISALSGKAGDLITVTGRNLPVSPVPPITFVSDAGLKVAAKVTAGNTSNSLSFIVPLLPKAGNYAVQAGDYQYPAKFFYVDATAIANQYAPYYTTGKMHDKINSFAGAADLFKSLGGRQYLYTYGQNRRSTGNACFAQINGDRSISRLNASGKELQRYIFENSNDSSVGPNYRLYAANNYGWPDTSEYVDFVPGGTSGISETYFLFNKPNSFQTELCASVTAEDKSFQFFGGPALDNWKKAEGVYTSSGITLYLVNSVSSGNYGWSYISMPDIFGGRYIPDLNLTINEKSTCEITVHFSGTVSFAVDGHTIVSNVNTSDKFQYGPPLSLKDINTLPSQIPPYFPANRNFRLISVPHPYILNTPTPMIIELGLPMQLGNNTKRSVTLFYGVSDYGATAGSYNYKGAISCHAVQRKGGNGAPGTYIDEILGISNSEGSATNIN